MLPRTPVKFLVALPAWLVEKWADMVDVFTQWPSITVHDVTYEGASFFLSPDPCANGNNLLSFYGGLSLSYQCSACT